MLVKSFKCLLVIFIIGIALPSASEEVQQNSQQILQPGNTPLQTQTKKQNPLKKTFHSVENFWNQQKNSGYLGGDSLFSPRIGNIATGSGIAAGARFGLSFMEASAAYSMRGYQEYELMIGVNPPREGLVLKRNDLMTPFQIPGFENADSIRTAFYADLRYHDYPQQDFYGRGSDSAEENWSDYRLQEAAYSGVFLVQWNEHLRMGARAGFTQPDIGRGTDGNIPNTQILFNTFTAPGLMDQPDFWRVNAGVLMDYRDHQRNPHEGGALGVHVLWVNDRSGDRYEFTRYTIDGRYFQPIGSQRQVVAIRMLTSLSDVGPNQEIPFYYLDSLGGSHTLRGFHSQRFQDNNLMHFSTEFRFEAKRWLELAAFYDLGKVFPRPSQFNLHDLESSYGAGVRFKSSKGVLFRVDGAHSREGYGVYLSLGSSF